MEDCAAAHLLHRRGETLRTLQARVGDRIPMLAFDKVQTRACLYSEDFGPYPRIGGLEIVNPFSGP